MAKRLCLKHSKRHLRRCKPSRRRVLCSGTSLAWQSIPVREFENPVFQDSLAAFLEQASVEPVDKFAAKTRKAGVELPENRDSGLIIQFLMTLLEANGGNRISVSPVRKRIKDDVCWHDAEVPWRRSPFWLALRVCAQRLLCLLLGAVPGHMQYKFLLCCLMAQLLQDSTSQLSPEERHFLKTKLCRRLAKLETETTARSTSAGSSRSAMSGSYAKKRLNMIQVSSNPNGSISRRNPSGESPRFHNMPRKETCV